MSYPAKYPPAVNPDNWNAMVDRINGFTPLGDFVSPYNWLVVFNGITSVYDVCNAFQIAYSNANAATAIQWALNNLTAGRTWKEKVVLRGDFTTSASLVVPSYTALQIEGRIKTADNVLSNMITLVNGASNVELLGGILDNNEANYAGGVPIAGIVVLQNCSSVIIRGVTTLNALYDHYLFDAGTKDVLVENCIADGGRDDGFNPLNVRGISFVGCIARNMANDGFHLSVDSKDISVLGCISHDNGETGIMVFTNRCTLKGNLLYGNAIEGIRVAPSAGYVTISDNIIFQEASGISVQGSADANIAGVIVQGNIVLSPSSWGIVANYAPDIKIVDNYIDGPTTDYDSIGVLAGCSNALVQGNTTLNALRDDLKIFAGNSNVRVFDNDFQKGIIEDYGTTTKFRANLGFITENRGSATGTGAQQTIAHGCNFNPTYDQVFLSERSTGLAVPYQSAPPDVWGNIFITAANDKTYNWRVSYNP